MSAVRAESGTRRTLESLMSELRDRIELVEAENARLRVSSPGLLTRTRTSATTSSSFSRW